MARLPTPGGDDGNWGDILNDYLLASHNTDGTPKSNSINTNNINDGAITNIKLGDNSVTTSKINDASVTAAKLADNYIQQAELDAHADNTTNPHSVTKTQVGLGNVDNTSDVNKPISSATQTALDGKAAVAAAVPTGGTTAQILVKTSNTDYSTAWASRTPARYYKSLSTTFRCADHAVLKMLSDTFTPTTTTVDVDVQLAGQHVGVAHMTTIFAWNQTVAEGTSLLTGAGVLTGAWIANTSTKNLGPLSSPGNTSRGARRFRITGLTPGTPVTWEVAIASTGYYERISLGTTNAPDMAFSLDGRKLLITDNTNSQIIVVNPATLSWDNDGRSAIETRWSGTLSVPAGVCFHPTDPALFYVANLTGNNVQERSTVDGSIQRTFTVSSPYHVVASATKLWVAQQFSSSVTPITISTGTVGSAITTGASPRRPVVHGSYVYIACGNAGVNRVDRINLSTNALTTLATGSGTQPVAIGSDTVNDRLWVAQVGNGLAREIDPSTFTFTGQSINAGSLLVDVKVSPTGKSIITTHNATSNAHNWRSWINPPAGVQFEGTNLADGTEDYGRQIIAVDGSSYILNVTSGSLHYFQGADFTIDPNSEFWQGFADVIINEVST